MRHRRNWALRLVLLLTAACILLPLALLAVWSCAARWAWPALAPTAFSLRGLSELVAPHNQVARILGSSVLLSLAVAALATVCGLMTARACALYDFPGRNLLLFGSVLPIIVPGTVFAMGVHVVLIRMGLAGTVPGVILVHTVCSLPYTVNILTDVTAAAGDRLETQAQVLGCPPVKAFFMTGLPQLLPGVLSALCMAYIVSFSQYFLTLLIGGGRVKTFSVLMVPFISGGDRTLASAYALLFVLSVAMVFVVFEVCIRRLLGPRDRKEGKA